MLDIEKLPVEMAAQLKADLATTAAQYQAWLDHPFTKYMYEAALLWVEQKERDLAQTESEQTRFDLKLGRILASGEFARFAYRAARASAERPYNSYLAKEREKAGCVRTDGGGGSSPLQPAFGKPDFDPEFQHLLSPRRRSAGNGTEGDRDA